MENTIFYFHENNIETATTEINVAGWFKFTEEQTAAYLANTDLLPYWNGSSYELIDYVPPIFDLDTYKLEKIQELSYLSLSVGNVVAPAYKFDNCMISKFMQENGENPIYSNWEEVLNDYKNKRIALRDEFYRLKVVVENATSKEEIDGLFTIDIFQL